MTKEITDTNRLNSNIKDSRLKDVKKPVSSDHEIDVLDKQVSVTDKFKMTQDNEVVLTSVKYSFKDYKGHLLCKCKVRSYKEKFVLMDNKKNELYDFELIGKHSDLKLVINSKSSHKQFSYDIKCVNSQTIITYTIPFFNKATKQTENLYVYAKNGVIEIYHGRSKYEDGTLICRVEKMSNLLALTPTPVISTPRYDIEIASGIDRTFVLIIAIGLTRKVQVNNRYWGTNVLD